MKLQLYKSDISTQNDFEVKVLNWSKVIDD